MTNTILNNTLNEQDQPSETLAGYHTNRPFVDGGGNIQQPFQPTYITMRSTTTLKPNPIYADLLLAPLAENGGPNQTMAPVPTARRSMVGV
ncbi:MAG: hypothetical protein R2932_49085 [Caldilineaceae bacterium]